MNKQTPITEVQGYRDPYTQFKKGTVKEDVFEQIQRKKAEAEIVAAEQVGATRKQKKKAAGGVVRTKIANKIKQRNLVKDKPVSELQIESSYPELVDPVDVGVDLVDAQQTDTEMAAEARRFAQDWNEGDSRARAAKDITKLTEVPNIRFGGWGNEIPGSGAVVSSFTRALMNGAGAVVNEFGTIFQDAGAAQMAAFERNKAAAPELFGDQQFQPVSPIGELGAWMSSMGQDAAKTMEMVGKKKSDQSVGERIAGFAGEMTAQLPSMMAITELAGPTVGFGLMKVVGARAKGENDPLKLGAEFLLGAMGGHVFKELGKTSQWIDDVIGVETTAGRYFATGTHLGLQGIAGTVQEGIDAGLHPEQKGQRDWLDYTLAGLSNVVLDPLLLPGGSKRAEATVDVMRRRFEGANLDLPEIGKKGLREDYFHGDVPIENLTVKTLMDQAKIQFDETGDVMWVNPSAGVVLSRAAAALGKWKLDDQAAGTVLTASQAQDLANLLDQKSIQIKNILAEMGEPDAEARDLVTMAVQYEAMAEHLMAGVEGKESLKVRFGGADTTEMSDKAVIGHEAFHEEQGKIAKSGGVSIYDLHEPSFLLEHPIGAKVIGLIGGELEKNYPNPMTWTSEVMAYVAQPGNAGLGLSKQERGILLGDYLASVGKQNGVNALANFDAKWVDRDVASQALNRLAQRNFVELRRGNDGIPVGLIWKKGEDWPLTRSGDGSWKGLEIQPPRMVGKREDVNKAIKLNDLMWRLKGSKAVHADGELIRVYHGSPKGLEIKEVDFDKLNKNDWIKGFFTTQSAEVASGYSGHGGFGTVKLDNQGRNVHGFYLDVKNPLDLDADFDAGAAGSIIEAAKKAGVSDAALTETLAAGNFNEFIGELTRQIQSLQDDILINDPQYRELEAERKYLDEQVNINLDELTALETKRSELTATEFTRQYDELSKTGNDLRDAYEDIAIELEDLRKEHIPTDAGINKVREILLEAGYDGATHLGGDGRGKEFTDKVEAERYARETGGELVDDTPITYINYIAEEDGYVIGDQFGARIASDIFNTYSAALRYVENLPKSYKINGHKVWIAFKPEQVISATDLLPVTESYFGSDYENYKIDNWKEKLDKLRDEGKVEVGAANEIEQIFMQMNSEAGLNGLMENLPIPKAVEDGFGAGEGDQPKGTVGTDEAPTGEDKAKIYQEIFNEHKLTKAKLNSENRKIRDLAASARELKKLADSGIDVTDARKATQDQILLLQAQKAKTFAYHQKVIKELRARWLDIADPIYKEQQAKLVAEAEGKAKEYLEDKQKAQQRIDNFIDRANDPDNEYIKIHKDDPNYRSVINLQTFRRVVSVATDLMMEAGITPLPKEVKPFHAQLMDMLYGGYTDQERLHTALEKYGLTMTEITEGIIYAGSESGKIFQALSVNKRRINKHNRKLIDSLGGNLDQVFKENPQLELWFKSNMPTLKEIKETVQGEHNVMRFISLNDASLLLNVGTQMKNVVWSGINMFGQSVDNLMNSIEDRIRSGGYDVTKLDGSVERTAFENVPLVDSFRPLMETGAILNWLRHFDTIGWIDEGVRPVGRPSDRADRAIDLLDAITEAHPQITAKLLGGLDSDIEAMDLVKLDKSLEIMRRQVEFMPEGPDKTKRLSEIARSQMMLKKEGSKVSQVLRDAKAVMHKAMVIGRGPERVTRAGAFLGQAGFHLKKYGQDLDVLLKENRMHEANVDALSRAAVEALKITYGLKPDARDGTRNALVADYLKWLSHGTNKRGQIDPLAVGLRLAQKFQSFTLQAMRQVYEWSPLKAFEYGLKIAGAYGSEARTELFAADGDYSRFNKAFMGSLAWTGAWLFIKDKYDEAEEKNLPPEHPEWDSIGSVSVKGTPFGPMFYVADVIERKRRGLTIKENPFEAMGNLSADFRGIGGTLDFMDKFYENFSKDDGMEKQLGKAGDAILDAIGKWMSNFAAPLRNITDFATIFDEDQKTMKDIYGWGYGGLALPTLDKLPSSFIKQNGERISARELLLDRIDPYTGRPLMRNSPATQALTGFTLIPEQSPVGKLMTYHGEKLIDWIPFTGVKEVDRELVREIGVKANDLNKLYDGDGFKDVDLLAQGKFIDTRLKEISAEALDKVLIAFPDVRKKMEDEKELDKWEKRINEKFRAKEGDTSYKEMYENLKKDRLIKRSAVGKENIGQ